MLEIIQLNFQLNFLQFKLNSDKVVKSYLYKSYSYQLQLLEIIKTCNQCAFKVQLKARN